MFKKILLVRNEETFMVNAIKNLLKSKNYIVEDSSYSVGELNNKKQGVNLAILYTDEDIESHRDAMVFFKDMNMEENFIIIVIGDKDAFDLIHHYVPKEDIAYEITRPLDMADLMEKVAIVTDGLREYQK